MRFPSTDDVRGMYAQGRTDRPVMKQYGEVSYEEAEAEFDRWLAKENPQTNEWPAGRKVTTPGLPESPPSSDFSRRREGGS